MSVSGKERERAECANPMESVAMNDNVSPNPSPIDRSYLATIAGEDPEFERELVETYLEASEDVLARLRDGVARAHADDVRSAAHAIKGSSLAIGAQPLGDVCEALEQRARAADLVGAESLLARIEADYQTLAQYIKQTWAIAV